MAIITLDGHVSRALDFYNRSDIYFVIGKDTPWTEDDRTSTTPKSVLIDDYNPPLPELTSEIYDVVGAKRVERMYTVVPDPQGSLKYRDTRWKVVSPEDAFKEGARWIYMSTNLSYNELPIDISYRIISVSTRLKRGSHVDEFQYHLERDDIEDLGVTEIVDFRKPIHRDLDQKESLVIVMEF